jgi:hypothetical protein
MILGLTESRLVAAQDSPTPVDVTPAVPISLQLFDARQLPAPIRLSKAQRQAMYRNVLDRRERAAVLVDRDPASPPGVPMPQVRETRILGEGAEFHGPPSDILIGRNFQNPIAGDGTNSTVAEVSAVNDGTDVFYAGNWYTSYSTTGGSAFTEVAIPPAPPGAAQFFCCDIDVVYDAPRGVTIWSAVFCSAVNCSTTGDVIIFVQRTIPGGLTCAYVVNYEDVGLFPDYPHLGLSNKFLYLSTNVFDAFGWVRSDVLRADLDAVVDCASSPSALFYSYGGPGGSQRVFVPGTNTQHAMYLATLENTTQLRIHKWPETSSSVQQFLRTVAASSFPVGKDCRGGTGNNNVFSTFLDVSIIGFDTRVAVAGPLVGVWWPAGPAVSRPNVYVRAAIFQEPGLVLLGQPDIFSADHCMDYAAVTGSERDGHFALTIAFGGRTGGGGAAVSTGVAVDDDFTAGIGAFSTIQTTVTGTHNPVDGRYGDYLTITRQRPCGLWFAATGYALVGGADDSNVNARYVEFGRARDAGCYFGWRDKTRDPVPP